MRTKFFLSIFLLMSISTISFAQISEAEKDFLNSSSEVSQVGNTSGTPLYWWEMNYAYSYVVSSNSYAAQVRFQFSYYSPWWYQAQTFTFYYRTVYKNESGSIISSTPYLYGTYPRHSYGPSGSVDISVPKYAPQGTDRIILEWTFVSLNGGMDPKPPFSGETDIY